MQERTITMDKLRTVRFYPYRKGQGPIFVLNTWYLEGQTIQYQLTMNGRTLFKGKDFRCSPLDAVDSDDCVKSLMSFLTLRPGDVDQDYFADYSAAQREYCDQHATALAIKVYERFGE